MERRGAAKRAAEFEEAIRAELRPDLEIVRRLGGGPLSTVFLAREPALQRLVAVKVLHPHATRHGKDMARFRREARALARVSHPNVVSIFRVGDLSTGAPYLVMQYVRGTDLSRRLEAEGPLAPEEGCSVLAGIAAALAAVHAHGIVHRDVRPESVLCGEPDDRVVLADFGLAAFLASAESAGERITTTGHLVTDLAYSAPESLTGVEATSSSDVYSLGVLAYEVLTGAGPYDASTVTARVHAHLRQSPARLTSRGIAAPAGLEELLAACLAKSPSDRPSASECASRFEALTRSTAPQAAPPPSPRPAGAEEHDGAGQPDLYLRLLGCLDLSRRGHPTPAIVRQPKRVALLAFLAAGQEGSFKRRDALTALFWPDAEPVSARHSLRQGLYLLRRAVGQGVIRTRGDGEVGIDPAAMVCDVARFEKLAGAGRPAEALEHYGGDLLPGFYVDDSPEFERWLDLERVRLRRMAAGLCWDLARAAQQDGRTAEASRQAHRAVDLDPFDEAALHRLIELLDSAGDRAGALAAFDHFARRLADEYAVDPSPETVALVERVRKR